MQTGSVVVVKNKANYINLFLYKLLKITLTISYINKKDLKSN